VSVSGSHPPGLPRRLVGHGRHRLRRRRDDLRGGPGRPDRAQRAPRRPGRPVDDGISPADQRHRRAGRGPVERDRHPHQGRRHEGRGAAAGPAADHDRLPGRGHQGGLQRRHGGRQEGDHQLGRGAPSAAAWAGLDRLQRPCRRRARPEGGQLAPGRRRPRAHARLLRLWVHGGRQLAQRRARCPEGRRPPRRAARSSGVGAHQERRPGLHRTSTDQPEGPGAAGAGGGAGGHHEGRDATGLEDHLRPGRLRAEPGASGRRLPHRAGLPAGTQHLGRL
ncbi:MAG: hypothetical protein AVDCRST_MAG76-1289, partial [uncultured Acidimicrobiales bacterium]